MSERGGAASRAPPASGRSPAADRSKLHQLSTIGLPRAVRVWGEAWLAGTTVILTGEDLLLLVKPIRPPPLSPEFADAMTEFRDS